MKHAFLALLFVPIWGICWYVGRSLDHATAGAAGGGLIVLGLVCFAIAARAWKKAASFALAALISTAPVLASPAFAGAQCPPPEGGATFAELLEANGYRGTIDQLRGWEVHTYSSEERVLVTWQSRDRDVAFSDGGRFAWVQYARREGTDEVDLSFGREASSAPREPGPEIVGAWDRVRDQLHRELPEHSTDYAMGGQDLGDCALSCLELRASSDNADQAGLGGLGHGASVWGSLGAGALITVGGGAIFVGGTIASGGAITISGIILGSNPIGWVILGTGLVAGGILIVGGQFIGGRAEYIGGTNLGAGACPGCGVGLLAGWVYNANADACFDPDCEEYGGNDNGDSNDDPGSPVREPEGPGPGQSLFPEDVGGLGAPADDEPYCIVNSDCVPAPADTCGGGSYAWSCNDGSCVYFCD